MPQDLAASGDGHRRIRLLAVLGQNKVAATALLLASVGTATVGTLSTFTSASNRTQQAATGTFAFNLTDPGTGQFSTNVSGLAPGDLAQRTVQLTNPAGSLNYANVALTASATTSTLLNTDAVNGLTLTVQDCTVAWTQTSTTTAATCSGTQSTVTSATPLSTVISSGITWSSGLASLTAGGDDYLLFQYTLPSASTGVAGLTSVISYTLTATQRAGGSYH